MIYDHMVKVNGKYYAAGEDVPDNATENESSLPFSDKSIVFEEKPEEKKYTKTDINRMSKAELQEIAIRTGAKGAEDMTGQELKEYLYNMFDL